MLPRVLSRASGQRFLRCGSPHRLAALSAVRWASVTAEGRTPEGVVVARVDDGKVNSYGFDMIAELTAVLDAAEADPETMGLVIAGNGKAFSAGFDLSVMTGGDSDAIFRLVRAGVDLCLRLYLSRLPIVAASTGHSMALGAIMLNAVDHRIGANDDKFKVGMNEVHIGMPLPIFAMELARARMPGALFTKAVTQAVVCTPEHAVAYGYLDEVCNGEDVVPRAVEEAARLGKYVKPQLPAYHATKERERGIIAAHIRETVDVDIRSFSDGAAQTFGPK